MAAKKILLVDDSKTTLMMECSILEKRTKYECVTAAQFDGFDREAVLTSFIAETQEGLDLMEQSLLAMESRSGGAELLDDIFRVAHTLKGNADSLSGDSKHPSQARNRLKS